MEQKIFERLNGSNANFMYDKENQKLVTVQLVSAIYYIESGEVEEMCILGGDSEIQRICNLDNQYYCSEAAFKSGAQLGREHAVIKETLKDDPSICEMQAHGLSLHFQADRAVHIP